MTRASAGRPASCQTTKIDTTNDPSIQPEARPPDTPFANRRPSVALMTKPTSGNRGISASTRCLPFQRCKSVGIERLAMPEERDDQRQADGRFRRGHGHHEKRDDLPVHVAAVPAKGHERQVHGVQHDFDGQQNRDQVTAEEHAGRADGEQNRRHDQIVMERNHDSPSLRASTTAPTMATRISTDVASNANAWRSKSTFPSSRTELTVVALA